MASQSFVVINSTVRALKIGNQPAGSVAIGMVG